MAHPFLEALYIGLLASGSGQAVDAPQQIVTPLPLCSHCVESPARSPRIVYNWSAGTRSVYSRNAVSFPNASPMVGMTEWQVRRLAGSGES
jgi:hypothetical protein